MYQRECKLFAMNLGLIKRMVEPLSDADMRQSAAAGANPPVWILAHLCVVADFALEILRQPKLAPPDWASWCGPGSSPDNLPATLPTKSQLLDHLERVHAAVIAAAPNADPAALAVPHTVSFFQNTPLTTWGDVLAAIMTNHEALHIGQLSQWRRVKGLPPLF